MIPQNETKIREAKSIVDKCLGKHGVWASPYRYKYQCWTRDFVIATEDVLLNSGRYEIIKTHISQLAKRQGSKGQIPIMFLDNTVRWLVIKIRNSIRKRRMSFLLKAFLSKGGVAGLSPWTRDSEFLFVIGVMKYVRKAQDQQFFIQRKRNLEKAIAYIEVNLMKNGLIYGVDWRDTRPDLDGKFLLTNNCFLYQAYSMLGEDNKARGVRDEINRRFWNGTYYRDHPDTDDWDTLGNALSILFDVAQPEYAKSIFKRAEELDTPFGYKLNSVTLPPKNSKEAELMNRINQYGVIWPFIHGFMILAAIKAGFNDLAKTQFAKWNQVDGFFEWYDPITGQGYGSKEQLWSAALYLRTAEAISRIG